MSESISWPKTNCTAVSCSVMWYEHRTAYMIDMGISPHGETTSNVMFSRSLVLSMLLAACWIFSKITFACGFLIVAHVGFTEKYLSNGNKFLLNSEPLPKIYLRVLGYLDSHNSLNIWYILAEDWSMIGNYAISNHPAARSLNFMHNSWSSFVSKLLSGCMTLASIVYVTMGSTHTVCHFVFKVSESLAGGNPYLELRFLNFWQYLQVLHIFRSCSTIPENLKNGKQCLGKSITIWMLEIEMIPFWNTCANGFGHINPIVIMDKVDTFDQLVLPIEVSLIDIGPHVRTWLSLEFQILCCLHNLKS